MVNYKNVSKAELEKECEALGLEKGSKAEMIMRVREAKDNEVIYDPNYPDAAETDEPGPEADPELAKMSSQQMTEVIRKAQERDEAAATPQGQQDIETTRAAGAEDNKRTDDA